MNFHVNILYVKCFQFMMSYEYMFNSVFVNETSFFCSNKTEWLIGSN